MINNFFRFMLSDPDIPFKEKFASDLDRKVNITQK